MCKQQRETVGHILWECPFARRVWALAKGKIQKSSASALNFFLLTQTMVQGEVLAESLREYRPKAGTELFLDLERQWPPLDFQKKNLVYIYSILFLAICFNKITLAHLNNIIDIFKCYKKNISPPIKIKPKQHTKKKKIRAGFNEIST